MNRLKAVYRSWAIPCAGRDVYYRRHRAQWLAKIREAGVRRRAERLYEQLDMLQPCGSKRGGNCGRKSEACHHRVSCGRFRIWGRLIGAGGGPDPDSASFPQQATTVGL